MAEEASRCSAVTFVVPVNTANFFADAIASDALAVSISGEEEDAEHKIQAILNGRPDENSWRQRVKILGECVGLSNIEIFFEDLPDKNWLLEVQKSFRPIQAGRFFVHGSHYDGPFPDKPRSGDRASLEPSPMCESAGEHGGIIKILIDAGMAFGSGEHASTKGCLEAIDKVIDGYKMASVLDVGTGSGILAIAVAKAAPEAKVIGCDIDPPSVKVAIENTQINSVPHVQMVESDGFANPVMQQGKPYNLVIANILARPLIAIAPEVAVVMADGGMVILSGLLTTQAEDVVRAYVEAGLSKKDEIRVGEWSTLIMEKL